MDVSNLSYSINCFFPGRQPYAQELDLPLAVALLSSYLQRQMPANALFVGELDLTSRVRPPEPSYLAELAQILVRKHAGMIERVYLSTDAQRQLEDHLAEEEKAARADGASTGACRIEVKGVRNLTALLNLLWPELGVSEQEPGDRAIE